MEVQVEHTLSSLQLPTGPKPGGGPDFFELLGGNEFRLRQGFAPQNACTPQRGAAPLGPSGSQALSPEARSCPGR